MVLSRIEKGSSALLRLYTGIPGFQDEESVVTRFVDLFMPFTYVADLKDP